MTQALSTELNKTIADVIIKRLKDGLDADVTVKSIVVSENTLEITIEVEIQTAAKPEDVASRYFGLTGRVRDALGERWRDFYPVITPTFTEGTHA